VDKLGPFFRDQIVFGEHLVDPRDRRHQARLRARLASGDKGSVVLPPSLARAVAETVSNVMMDSLRDSQAGVDSRCGNEHWLQWNAAHNRGIYSPEIGQSSSNSQPGRFPVSDAFGPPW
jgi:hypothetical protein